MSDRFFFLLHDWLGLVVSEDKLCFVKGASNSKCRHYRYTVRSIHVKL